MTRQNEAPQTSSSMEEVVAKRPEEVRATTVKDKPQAAHLEEKRASPPQSALRADSSSIEEERGAKSWLRRRAKAMRSDMTPAEKAMWRLLHEGELLALNWRRQAAFGEFILDFVSHPARLVIEVDGSQHGEREQAQHDADRTAWLRSEGYTVLRFWNDDVLKASDAVWCAIQATAAATPASARLNKWRVKHLDDVRRTNEIALASSSMEEAPRSGGGGARAVTKKEPPEARLQGQRATPLQSSLRDDSSSIEEEQNA